MTYKVNVTKPAERDVDQAFVYIEKHSPAAAVAWLDAVQQAIESLTEMPFRAAQTSENTGLRFKYRHLIYQNYRIVFRVDDNSTTVLVVRGKQVMDWIMGFVRKTQAAEKQIF